MIELLLKIKSWGSEWKLEIKWTDNDLYVLKLLYMHRFKTLFFEESSWTRELLTKSTEDERQMMFILDQMHEKLMIYVSKWQKDNE